MHCNKSVDTIILTNECEHDEELIQPHGIPTYAIILSKTLLLFFLNWLI